VSDSVIDNTRQAIATDRLRLLAIGYYIYGGIGAALSCFFLVYFFVLLAFSFIPESQWNKPVPARSVGATFHVSRTSPAATATPASPRSDFPPVIMLRIFAGIFGGIVVLGWVICGLTAYVGRCIQKRKHKVFIYVMAGICCFRIPYGTALGIATIMLFQWPEVQAQFKTQV
jgi:hypothetical protein